MIADQIASMGALVRASRRLAREQWASAAELAARREVRLQRLLRRAAAAPYYGAALREAGVSEPGKVTAQDLERLPLLDREVIARHGLEAFLTGEGSGLIQVTTSGSTGTPGRFLRSQVEEAEFSARWRRVYAAFGCRVLDAQVNLAAVGKPPRGGAVGFLRKVGIVPRVEIVASNAAPEQALERVRTVAPAILTGYAGAIEALADHVLATGARITPPRAVFCTAMEVTDRCLEVAERAFRAPAVDVYVTNEFGVIAWSCPARRDVLHLNDDALVIEVLGPGGAPIPPGTDGEVVVTSLGLISMPLIRYRMGDIAARLSGPCGCGRGLGLLSRVKGRTAHVVRGPDGAVITTPTITSLFGRARSYEWVRRFQVREEPGHVLRVLLETRQPPSEEQLQGLAGMLQSGLGPNFSLAFDIVDQVPLSPNGKLQFLVPLRLSP